MPTAGKFYYFSHEVENADSPPIILIHGAGGSHLHFPPELRRLNGFQIVAPDLPGHGKTEGIGRQNINDYVESIQKFMGEINLVNAVVIGHSMGAAIALQLALDVPEKVLGLVILGGGSRLGVSPSILEKTANEAIFPLAVEKIIKWSFAPDAPPRLKELAAQRMFETRPAVLHGDFIACNAFDISERLTEIEKSTLILCGTEDKMTPPQHSKTLHEKMPNSELKLIEGAGHMLMLEKAREVAEEIECFIVSLQT